MTEKQPWERSPLEIEIVGGYSAQIFAEDEEDYLIRFRDHDLIPAKARIPKAEFENFPHPIEIGTHLGLIAYSENGEPPIACPWPTKHYWNPELRGE